MLCFVTFYHMNLANFLRKATKRERADVAVVCNDSVGYLYQLAGGHRHASPSMAIKLEASTRWVAERSDGRLRPVPRETLVRNPDIFDPEASSKLEFPG